MSSNTTLTNVSERVAHATNHVRSILSRGQEEWFATIPGETVRIRIPSTSVAGRYSIVEGLALPMAGTPMHIHQEEEVFHILEGVLTFEVGGERFEGTPGMLVVVPGGVPHAWRNFGDRLARSMIMFTPGGIETLFSELANLSPVQVAELAARYGSAVVGPPIER
jgi:mannose-6-phosphate isomerase-like protein (cupin superfamily)